MSNRHLVLDFINRAMARVKLASTREQRFDLLENISVLSDILKDVTTFEQGLLADLDVE